MNVASAAIIAEGIWAVGTGTRGSLGWAIETSVLRVVHDVNYPRRTNQEWRIGSQGRLLIVHFVVVVRETRQLQDMMRGSNSTFQSRCTLTLNGTRSEQS